MKVAILGTENSHAYAFARLMKTNPKFADMELVGVYGYDKAPSEKIVADGYADYIAQTPDEFVGKVDAVIITARHGDLHYEYAMPYIKAGVSMFVDKPFTVKEEYAKEMIALAKQTGSKMVGGSSLKFLDELKPLARFAAAHEVVGGNVAAPINMVNEYGGFYFYSQHLIEMLFKVFGTDVKSVVADCKDVTKNRVNVIFEYENFDVTANYYDCYTYSLSVFAKDAAKQMETTDILYCYEHELNELHELMMTGEMPHTYEDLIKPVTLLNCIEKSYLTGKKVDVVW